jgi:hypothetical protein
LQPLFQISETTLAYLPAFRKKSFALYQLLVLMVVAALACLPFVRTTIAVTAQGITHATASAATAVADATVAVADYVGCLYDNLDIEVFGITIKSGCACGCS